MTPAAQASFAARMAQLGDAIEFVESFCERHRVGRADTLRLTLVVEELFTNTVEHGFMGDSDAPVRLELECAQDALKLLFEDTAPPFNPLVHDGNPPVGPEAPPGGQGIRIIRQLAASARHAYEDGRNRLWITLRREA